MQRDFTFVDDVVLGIVKALNRTATPVADYDPAGPLPHVSSAPFRIFNIGNSKPVQLLDFVKELETALGMRADIQLVPRQHGEVVATWADTSELQRWTNFTPATRLSVGVQQFVEWYIDFYRA